MTLEGVLGRMPFGHFHLGSHNFIVTALGSCVKWPSKKDKNHGFEGLCVRIALLLDIILECRERGGAYSRLWANMKIELGLFGVNVTCTTRDGWIVATIICPLFRIITFPKWMLFVFSIDFPKRRRGTILWVCTLSKVDVPKWDTTIIRTPIFEWYVVKCGSKKWAFNKVCG